ncbi:prolipoprotein diacylglyceryl transferase [Crassaminicella thermophila]|uniref:Phosphatidylglycerol--prolipoprotein diacylglyceryl transferase n=1 Tax=Crassaminicella thermophila TaxID=2599308 RepID=A0A5C0SDC7_CRATE|nr:prolipoprotein diacylglyceryl transferase [Crassaminicella thermophila]QEK11942.1 prolipoprotein diacylglyceryl transferase [Crassaminicella thermophila]
MDPVAFKLFGLEIRWYGIIISIGMVLGTIIAIKRAKKENISEEKVLDLLLFAIPSAIIGARAYYVIFNWKYYAGDIFSILNIRGGGLAIHGGVIGGVLVGYLYCKKQNISFRKMADICAPSIILGQAIGRWGNFVNQEAYGGPTDLPWGIMINGVKVHPTFLYESIWDFLVFCFLIWYDKRKKFEGELILFYAALYSVARFFIEGLRVDSLMLGPFRVAQLVSITAILLAGTIIYIGRKNTSKIG